MAQNTGKRDLSGYQYSAMSSLVLNADRRGRRPPGDDEGKGEAESLVGRIDPKSMGARAFRESVDTSKVKKKAAARSRTARDDGSSGPPAAKKARTTAASNTMMNARDIIAAADQMEGMEYIPRTAETREAYELILSAVHDAMGGEQPQDVIRDATDFVIVTLKDDSLKDLDRKREIGTAIPGISMEQFTTFVNLGKKITDFGDDAEGAGKGGDGRDPDDAERSRREGMIDDDVGVAVVFEDDEEGDEDRLGDEDEDSDADAAFEVRDDSEDEDADAAAVRAQAGSGGTDASGSSALQAQTGDDQDSEIIIGGGGGSGSGSTQQQQGSSSSSKSKKTDDGIIPASSIDGFWLQRLISTAYSDPHESSEKTSAALSILSSEGSNMRDVENALVDLFDYENFELVKTLTRNREKIVWCTKLARSDDKERMDVEVTMREKGVGWILKELAATTTSTTADGAGASRTGAIKAEDGMEVDSSSAAPAIPKTNIAPGSLVQPKGTVDLESMIFSQGSRLMSNKKCKLPEGSFKRSKKGYEEIHVPPPKKGEVKQGELVPIADLPEWTRVAFKGARELNRVQSRLYPVAFGDDDPILLCAPTGAGKTNVAMLTILNEMSKHRDPDTGAFDFDNFKIIYIAPMKALVQEMVGSFSARLEPFGIKVNELTGDRSLTKQQISETQIIVTTPEKWDVITRKSTDTSYTNLVRLIIIDEIHLLHDDRGPVLEAIVSRTIRRMEQTQDYVRLVGLSATLPNYEDVARFLRVNPKKGLFHFDATFRPCPLKQEFIGVTEKKALKRFQVMNEVCYEKVLEQVSKGEQVLIFVHSRKETSKTAKFIRDLALEKETITTFVKPDGAVRELLQEEASTATDANLKDLLQFGFGIHHAGMNRVDRSNVEGLFAEGHIQVLCCTATLAWGVNLPAHCAIIKGTQIYNPEKGRWTELSPQDVLQMLGRAGRPQYDTFGEGIIITNHGELQYYLSMMNQQLPIESQFVGKLADNLNAEIVLGTIRNRDEAVTWLGYTYWFCRALGSPSLYGIPADFRDEDPYLLQKRADIIHTAAVQLEKCGLVKYDRRTGQLQTTELGRIASHYYITPSSMATYNQHLRPTITFIELFRIFALSDEFKYIPVREEEKIELNKLLERVPIPIKEGVEDPTAKVNVLLQAYISGLKLDGFALMTDMVYITQSAGRILRALFEICMKRGWASLMYKALDMCKMVEKRMWPSMTPLRQFPGIPADIVRRAERKEFPWYRYFDLEPAELGELIGLPKAGRLVHRLVHQFPKMEIQAHAQPITRSMLKVELTLTPDFKWDEKVHGSTETFWVVVEDVDGELILFHEQFQLRERFAVTQDEHFVTFTVPMLDPLPPNYFITVVSDRWLASETRLPLVLRNLILPEKFPPPTNLLDLQPLPTSALHNAEFEAIYSSTIERFNKIQTQVFQALYTTNDNVFVGAPTGSGKTICAEFALLRLWSQDEPGRAVCIEPYQELVDLRLAEWQSKFGKLQGGKTIMSLTGEQSEDLRRLKASDVIICTPTQWDILSRRWKSRADVKNIALLIADEIQLLGGDVGPTYEVIVSRTRYVSAETGSPTRIVCLGVSLANARDLGEWIGATSQTIFNFSPGARPLPMEVHLQSFNVPHFPSLMLQMAKPTYLAITEYAGSRPTIVFVPSRKQCRLSAMDIQSYCRGDQDESRFLNMDAKDLAPHLERVQDEDLKETLEYGIGFYHEGMSKQDKMIVERLYTAGAIQVVVASKDTAWSIPLSAYMVILMGVQTYEGKEHRYVDYAFTDVLQMMGRACRPKVDQSSKCVIMCPQVRKPFFVKFLNEGLPIESHLPSALHDHFTAEVVTKTIENKHDAVNWCTWQWFYRRLVANPFYYNMHGNTHDHMSNFLSDLVETTLNDLSNAKAIEIIDDMDTAPLNLGMIAAYYNINHETVAIFNESLTEKTKLRGLLEIVSASTEFESIPIRHHEDAILKKIYDRVPVKLPQPDFSKPDTKTNILLQAHFSRLSLPADLASDQAIILGKVLNLLSACVDVMSSNSFINALQAMDLSQMIVQAVWNTDSPLRQIPHFSKEVIERCTAANVKEVVDIPELEDEDRTKLLQMNNRQLMDVARFCNAFPDLEVTHEVQDADDLSAGSPITVSVNIEREVDEDADGNVYAPFYPGKKSENWWVVIGEQSTKRLLAIRRLPFKKEYDPVKLSFELVQGKHDLTIYCISDCVMGADRTVDFSVDVKEGADSDEDDDSDEEMEE